MRRRIARNMMVMGLALGGILAAGAAEVSLEADVFSQYVWRGQVLNDRPVFQPGLSAESDVGLSVGVWASMDLTDRNGAEREFSEVDLWVAYAVPLEGPLGVEVSYTEYLWPNAELAPVREAALALSFDVPLAPTLTAAQDLDTGGALYVSLSLGHTVELSERLGLDLGGSLGWATAGYNELYFEEDQAALNDVAFTAALTADLGRGVSLGISVQYSMLPDRDIREAARLLYAGDTAWVAGLRLGYRF